MTEYQYRGRTLGESKEGVDSRAKSKSLSRSAECVRDWILLRQDNSIKKIEKVVDPDGALN